jgi:hypothetical protein
LRGTLIGLGIIAALVLTDPAAPRADRPAGEVVAAAL